MTTNNKTLKHTATQAFPCPWPTSPRMNFKLFKLIFIAIIAHRQLLKILNLPQ